MGSCAWPVERKRRDTFVRRLSFWQCLQKKLKKLTGKLAGARLIKILRLARRSSLVLFLRNASSGAEQLKELFIFYPANNVHYGSWRNSLVDVEWRTQGELCLVAELRSCCGRWRWRPYDYCNLYHKLMMHENAKNWPLSSWSSLFIHFSPQSKKRKSIFFCLILKQQLAVDWEKSALESKS